MDENKLADLTMQFLNRVHLQGNEVMAFVACMQWLEAKKAPPPPQEPPAPPAPPAA